MADKVLLREGIDVALRYFNYGDSHELPSLTRKARVWASSYYGGHYHFPGGEEGLTKAFPDLFNLSTHPHLRLSRRNASLASPPRLEARSSTTEPFPIFVEPMMATDEDITDILSLRCRRPSSMPRMAVSALHLQTSGLLASLPEFMSQLAHGDLKLATRKAQGSLSTAPDRPRPQRPRRSTTAQLPRHDGRGIHWETRPDVCASPPAAERAVLSASRKRKVSAALEADVAESTPVPTKVRLVVPYYPPPLIKRFDLALGVTVLEENPAARDLSPDPFAQLQVARRAAAKAKAKKEAADTLPSPALSSTPAASPRIIKIKVRPRSQSRTAAGPVTPPLTPPTTSSSRRIKLRDPRWDPSRRGLGGSGLVRIKLVRRSGSASGEQAAR